MMRNTYILAAQDKQEIRRRDNGANKIFLVKVPSLITLQTV